MLQYLSPEVIQEQPHTFAVDWWGVGICLFDIMCGKEPFRGDSQRELFVQIMVAKPLFPDSVTLATSSQVRQLVRDLTAKTPRVRLGSQTMGGATGVKRHPFFRNTDWEAMLAMTIPPPASVAHVLTKQKKTRPRDGLVGRQPQFQYFELLEPGESGPDGSSAGGSLADHARRQPHLMPIRRFTERIGGRTAVALQQVREQHVLNDNSGVAASVEQDDSRVDAQFNERASVPSPPAQRQYVDRNRLLNSSADVHSIHHLADQFAGGFNGAHRALTTTVSSMRLKFDTETGAEARAKALQMAASLPDGTGVEQNELPPELPSPAAAARAAIQRAERQNAT